MQKAASHINDSFILWQNNIRMAWQFCAVQSKTKSMPKEKRADNKLRGRIFAEDSPHSSASGNLVVTVHYRPFSEVKNRSELKRKGESHLQNSIFNEGSVSHSSMILL